MPYYQFNHTCGWCQRAITIVAEADTEDETYCDTQCRAIDQMFRSVWDDAHVVQVMDQMGVTWVCDVEFPAKGVR